MSNLIINVRCTCEEEFLLLHKLHKLYQEDQLRKRLKERLVAAQGNGGGTVTETVERTFAPEGEVAFDPNAEDYRSERGDSWKGIKARPKITLTEVLEAEALENAERLDA